MAIFILKDLYYLIKKERRSSKTLLEDMLFLLSTKNQRVLTLEVGMWIIQRKRYVKQIETYKPD
jgi:hypothetical protein